MKRVQLQLPEAVVAWIDRNAADIESRASFVRRTLVQVMRGEVHRAARGDHAVADTHRLQRPAGLIQQLHPVHQHRDPVAAGGRLLGDVTEHHRLAAAGGQHEQHGSVPSHESKPQLIDGVLLVRAQGESHARLQLLGIVALGSARATLAAVALSP